MPEFDEASDGRSVRFTVGERFRIRLKENRTSGFRWRLEGGLASFLQLIAENYEPASLQPGAGGVHTWDFQCVAQGLATLVFGMSRSWETGPPARRFSITADVTAP
jgi:predicted secreted protein